MKNFTFLFLAISVIFSSCTDDNKSLNSDDIKGTWVCIDAGDKSELIAKSESNPGAEIIFKGNKLTFPILETAGKEKEQEFSIKNSEIHCANDKDLIFKIKDLADKKMTLEFSLQGHDFVLVMEKSK